MLVDPGQPGNFKQAPYQTDLLVCSFLKQLPYLTDLVIFQAADYKRLFTMRFSGTRQYQDQDHGCGRARDDSGPFERYIGQDYKSVVIYTFLRSIVSF